jgi:hypothetical protein
MKLVKIMRDFDIPLKEDVTAIFSKDLEKVLNSEYTLISDQKYRLLQFAGVKIHVYDEFNETEASNMGLYWSNMAQQGYVIVDHIIKPSEFSEEEFDLSSYNVGENIFFYVQKPDEEIPEYDPEKVLEEATSYYGITASDTASTQSDDIIKNYTEEIERITALYKDYNEALESPYFGMLGTVTTTKEKVKEIDTPPLVIFGEKKLLINFIAKPVTTKDVAQFGVEGKLPKSAPSLITTKIGGCVVGDSIKNTSLEDIITKLFILESEEDEIGTIKSTKSSSTEETE